MTASKLIAPIAREHLRQVRHTLQAARSGLMPREELSKAGALVLYQAGAPKTSIALKALRYLAIGVMPSVEYCDNALTEISEMPIAVGETPRPVHRTRLSLAQAAEIIASVEGECEPIAEDEDDGDCEARSPQHQLH